MNYKELGQKVKEKYPQYANMPDEKVGELVAQKYPQYGNMITDQQETAEAKKDKSFIEKTGDFLGIGDFGRGIGQTLFQGTKEAKQLQEQPNQKLMDEATKKLSDPNLSEERKAKYKELLEGINQGKADSGEILTGGLTNRQILGSAAQTALNVATAGLANPSSLVGKVAQNAALAGGFGAAHAYGEGKHASEIFKAAGQSAVLGAGIIGAGSLIAKSAKAIAPKLLGFTSKVPEAAISEALNKPGVVSKARKAGNVAEIRNQAVQAVKQLKRAIGDTYNESLSKLPAKPVAQKELTKTLADNFIDIANEFKISGFGRQGEKVLGFGKSSIVNKSEQKALQSAYDTINSWADFTPEGLNSLLQRVSALRKFESGGMTKKSAILGKIYYQMKNSVKKVAPELIEAKSQYSSVKGVLDKIDNVLATDKTKPNQINAAISKLANIYKGNKQEYVKVLRSIEELTGQDIMAQLAGLEFQKVMPALLGAERMTTMAALGAGAYFNPWFLLLAPLFSPRFVGAATTGTAKATQLAQKAATSSAGKLTSKAAKATWFNITKQ